MEKVSNIYIHILRRILSTLMRLSFSTRFTDFLLWPISKRLFGKYEEVVSIKEDLLIRVYGDMEDMVNKILLFTSEYVPLAWEPGTARLVEVLSKKCDFAIVAGSHIGYYPLIVGSTNHNCKVHAFEPNPINRSRCLDNIKLNNFNNVTVIDKALGKNVGREKMYFDFGQSSFIDSKRKHKNEGIVNVTTLDQFEKSYIGGNVLMVLDAEGYEKNIIEGGTDFISKNKPTIIFEINENALRSAGSSSKELCSILKKIGYSLYIISEGSHKISFDPNVKINLIPYEEYSLEPKVFVNAIAIIDNEAIKQYVYKK